MDVTKDVEDGVKGLNWNDRVAKLPEVMKSITDKVADKENGLKAAFTACLKATNTSCMFIKPYRDIRLVALPESVGKFGGDTDNWEWPRHTGDFSVFVFMAQRREAC